MPYHLSFSPNSPHLYLIAKTPRGHRFSIQPSTPTSQQSYRSCLYSSHKSGPRQHTRLPITPRSSQPRCLGPCRRVELLRWAIPAGLWRSRRPSGWRSQPQLKSSLQIGSEKVCLHCMFTGAWKHNRKWKLSRANCVSLSGREMVNDAVV
jgi:hypothetical protein